MNDCKCYCHKFNGPDSHLYKIFSCNHCIERVSIKTPSTGKPKDMNDWELEKRFIVWAESRDDDWWNDGNGSCNIWDVRIMLDFVKRELASQEARLVEKINKIITKEMRTYSNTPISMRMNGFSQLGVLRRIINDSLTEADPVSIGAEGEKK